MKIHAAVATFLFLHCQVSLASNEQGVFNVLGLGTHRCEQFVEAANPGEVESPWTDYNLYTAYATGYLTGYNEFVDGTVDIRGQNKMLEIMAMVEAFCEENPSEDLHAGLVHVVGQLEPYRDRGPDEPF